MDYSIKQKLEKVIKNKYKAVIVASRLARKINDKRVAEYEQLGPDAPLPRYPLKVTTEAINEVADGKVNYSIVKDKPSEEEMFPG
ncbi:MAG: DNA-directed RNA polymerase subunit omega [candidate division Zixibacteria bacterium]|nr:DNA-directed RNA polymerase subunit omega [candidate division Zixibacteria bacterium]